MNKPVIVSVVRDKKMYSKCIENNPNCTGCDLTVFDNAAKNIGIPIRYNSFLDNMDKGQERWIAFCHEDWKINQDLCKLVETLDKKCIYGPVGAYAAKVCKTVLVSYSGHLVQANKNGSGKRNIRFINSSSLVDTVDCQCIIVHSGIFDEHPLRFDESLEFDLYSEDFCANAFANFGISTRTVSIDCTHFSPGVISKRFDDSLKYLDGKYRCASKRFASIVGYKTVFGGDNTFPVHRTKFPDLISMFDSYKRQ